MPRVRTFDENAVLDAAMQVFWEKGYEATSINELIESTGLNRGSLYNAYLGKRPLFVKALLKYDQENRRATLAQFEALDDPKRAIGEIFDAIVTQTISDTSRKGCFLVNTASELGVHDADVREIVDNGLREFEAFFRRAIEVGQARGEIQATLQPEETAKVLLALVVAIRVLGRGAYTEPALRTLADKAKSAIEAAS